MTAFERRLQAILARLGRCPSHPREALCCPLQYVWRGTPQQFWELYLWARTATRGALVGPQGVCLACGAATFCQVCAEAAVPRSETRARQLLTYWQRTATHGRPGVSRIPKDLSPEEWQIIRAHARAMVDIDDPRDR